METIAMTVFSYIVTHDTGFAPNPFHGWLTLACCKPSIRRTAQVGDWVVGLSRRGERVIFAANVSEKLAFDDYWSLARFKGKVPDRTSSSAVVRRGDNIYEPLGSGVFRQLPSRHSNPDGTENPEGKTHDLGGGYVLVADEFVYFGGHGPALPAELAFLVAGRGHRCRFTSEQVAAFTHWVSGLPRGIAGRPAMWPPTDDTWREQR